MRLLAVALGGAIGSIFRYLILVQVNARVPSDLPWGTLSVNVVGSFAIGLFYVVMQQRVVDDELFQLFVVVGLLGGFTTFSTFSLETLLLLQTGLWLQAILNIIASVTSCIAAAFAGMATARWLV